MTTLSAKEYCSALVVIPPQSLWAAIQGSITFSVTLSFVLENDDLMSLFCRGAFEA